MANNNGSHRTPPQQPSRYANSSGQKRPTYSERYNRPNPYTGYLPPGVAGKSSDIYHPEGIDPVRARQLQREQLYKEQMEAASKAHQAQRQARDAEMQAQRQAIDAQQVARRQAQAAAQAARAQEEAYVPQPIDNAPEIKQMTAIDPSQLSPHLQRRAAAKQAMANQTTSVSTNAAEELPEIRPNLNRRRTTRRQAVAAAQAASRAQQTRPDERLKQIEKAAAAETATDVLLETMRKATAEAMQFREEFRRPQDEQAAPSFERSADTASSARPASRPRIEFADEEETTSSLVLSRRRNKKSGPSLRWSAPKPKAPAAPVVEAAEIVAAAAVVNAVVSEAEEEKVPVIAPVIVPEISEKEYDAPEIKEEIIEEPAVIEEETAEPEEIEEIIEPEMLEPEETEEAAEEEETAEEAIDETEYDGDAVILEEESTEEDFFEPEETDEEIKYDEYEPEDESIEQPEDSDWSMEEAPEEDEDEEENAVFIPEDDDFDDDIEFEDDEDIIEEDEPQEEETPEEEEEPQSEPETDIFDEEEADEEEEDEDDVLIYAPGSDRRAAEYFEEEGSEEDDELTEDEEEIEDEPFDEEPEESKEPESAEEEDETESDTEEETDDEDEPAEEETDEADEPDEDEEEPEEPDVRTSMPVITPLPSNRRNFETRISAELAVPDYHPGVAQDETLFIRKKRPEAATAVFSATTPGLAPDVDDDDFFEQWLEEGDDMIIKDKRQRRRVSAIIGAVTMIFALIGFSFIVFKLVEGLPKKNTTSTKTNYASYILPVINADPDPFETVSASDNNVLVEAAINRLTYGEAASEHSYTAVDVEGETRLLLPLADVEESGKELFGPSFVVSVSEMYTIDDEEMFYYSAADGCFHVVMTGSDMEPEIIKISRVGTGSQITLDVGYISDGAEIEDEDDYYKMMQYILDTTDDDYYISAIREME